MGIWSHEGALFEVASGVRAPAVELAWDYELRGLTVDELVVPGPPRRPRFL